MQENKTEIGNGFQTTYEDYQTALREAIGREKWTEVKCAIDERSQNAGAKLSKYCELFPRSPFDREIKALIAEENELVQDARRNNFAEAYGDYLAKSRLFTLPAKALIEAERAEFAKCKRGNAKTRKAACQSFIANWPNSKHVAEVAELRKAAQEETLRGEAKSKWEAVLRKNTVQEFDQFIASWPLSEFAGEATQRRDALIAAARKAEVAAAERAHKAEVAAAEQRQREAKVERARRTAERLAQEQKVFDAALAHGEIDGYTDFLANFPNSTFEPRVRELLDKLRAESEGTARLNRMKQVGRDRSKAIKADSCDEYRNFLERWGKKPEGEWARNRLVVRSAEEALLTMIEKGPIAEKPEVNGPTLIAITMIADRFKDDEDEAYWYRQRVYSMRKIMHRRLFPGRLLPAFGRWLIEPPPPKPQTGYSNFGCEPVKPAKQGLQMRFFIAAAALVIVAVSTVIQDGLFWGVAPLVLTFALISLAVIVVDLGVELIETGQAVPFGDVRLGRNMLCEFIEFRRYIKKGQNDGKG
jgi:outer membrane protein assembly factor BamD (BamD/ComL family)